MGFPSRAGADLFFGLLLIPFPNSGPHWAARPASGGRISGTRRRRDGARALLVRSDLTVAWERAAGARGPLLGWDGGGSFAHRERLAARDARRMLCKFSFDHRGGAGFF